MTKKKYFLFAGIFTFIYLLFQVFLMKDYGLSWDYHYHYYAGRYHLGLSVPSINDPSPVPFSPPDPRLTTEDPFGPITQIVPTLSSYIFYERLHLLPFDSAYNLPMVVCGSLGIFLIFVILFEMFGALSAIVGMIFLALLPVHFGYLHTNMKDVPNAFLFSFSIYLFYRLTKKQTIQRLLLVSLSFALAFNTKINSVVAPVICGVYAIFLYIKNIPVVFKSHKLVLSFFVIAPILAVIFWLPFWNNPFQKLLELPRFYSNNTINMPILFFGEIFHSGVNIPFGYPFIYLFITTPPLVLIGFSIGIAVSIYLIVSNKKRREVSLLLIWFFVPLVRYLSPKAGAIDGVRHFMEVVYPFICISAVGSAFVISKIKNDKAKFLSIIISGLVLLIPIFNYHPYETSYFNFLVGGIQGAQGKFDIDFWGTPQKEAISWINSNAPPNSKVHIIMAQSSAAVYLRDDLLRYANSKDYKDSDYVVLLNRESFFDLYQIRDYKEKMIKNKKVVYEKSIEGVSLVWVFKN